MQRLTLTRTLALVAALALQGCAGDDKKTGDEKTGAPASKKPAPAAQPTSAATPAAARPSKPADPAPDAAPAEPTGSIVIKGSKRKDSSTYRSDSDANDPARQAQIEELKRKAADSQGKDNGTPVRGDALPDPAAKPALRDRKAVTSELSSIDTRVRALEDERKGLVDKQRNRHGSTEVPKDDASAARVTEIDASLADLKQQRSADLQELAAIDAAAPPPDKK